MCWPAAFSQLLGMRCTANSEFVALQFALAIMRQTNQLPILNRLPLLTIWFCCTLRLDTKRIMHPSISDR